MRLELRGLKRENEGINLEMRKAKARGDDAVLAELGRRKNEIKLEMARVAAPRVGLLMKTPNHPGGSRPMAKKTHARVMESLKKLGGKQGFLTYDQINDYLDEDASLGEMDEIYASLGKLKVDVVDSVEEGRQRLERRKARKKPAGAIVAQQPVRFDDPVRMYLREMGRVPLLDRQGEIEIAKRIEQGQDMVLADRVPQRQLGAGARAARPQGGQGPHEPRGVRPRRHRRVRAQRAAA